MLVMLLVVACSGSPDGAATGAPVETAQAPGDVVATASPRFAEEAPSDWDGGSVRLTELPPEASETLALIAQGGPYPYNQDGVHVPES